MTQGIHSGTKRQKFFDSAFSLVTALSYPDADMEHLRTAMDFLLWLFAVSLYIKPNVLPHAKPSSHDSLTI